MSNFRDKLRRSGYDAQEAYFHEREQELIQKMRARNQKNKAKLTLLQGGKANETPVLPAGLGVSKKAA